MYPIGHSMEGGRIGSSAIGSSTTGFHSQSITIFFITPPTKAKRSVKKIKRKKEKIYWLLF